MEWLIFAIIGLIVLFILSIFFEIVQCAVLALVGIARIVVSCYVSGFDGDFLLFAILTSISLVFLMGVDAFDSGTKGDILIKKLSDSAIEVSVDGNHPIKGLFASIASGFVFAGIEYLIFLVAKTFLFMAVICAIETIIAIISLVQAIKYECS